MDSIVKFLEKGQPFFDKVSKNIYLQAIKDGFMAAMPIILSSSVFLLIATLPGTFATVMGFTLPEWFGVVVDFCNKIYNFTMGIVGVVVAGTTASALAGSMNRRMPAGKVINATSAMIAAMCGMLLLAVTPAVASVDGADMGALLTDNMGTKGLLSSFVAAFATVNIYKFCIVRDITIKMPKEVPGTIAQNFRDIFAFSFSILFTAIIDAAVRYFFAVPFANLISTLISPPFAAADSYAGLALIWFMIPLFWFMGIHGPSVVKPPLNAALFGNIELNMAAFQAGEHPALALTENFGNYIGELGGTGATFVVPIIFLFLMHSKQLKAVGKASIVPVMFAVNEPLLFAAPIILNPYFLIPFLFAPVANVLIGKFFIDALGMNGFLYAMPWALPGPIGTFLCTNMQLISLVCVAVLLVVDFLIYYPFCKAYDNVLLKEEAEKLAEETAEAEVAKATSEPAAAIAAPTTNAAVPGAPAASATAGESDLIAKAKASGKQLKVLVLCAGAGTSALLANALKDGAGKVGLDMATNAGAYGSHYDIMGEYDVIVLAPQVRTYYNEMKADTDRLGIKLLSPRGKEYIDLTNDPTGAVDWILKNLEA